MKKDEWTNQFYYDKYFHLNEIKEAFLKSKLILIIQWKDTNVHVNVQNMNLDQYSAIVTVSGDGLIHEVGIHTELLGIPFYNPGLGSNP